MDNFNINENTMNKLKDMMNKGDLSQIMSQIPPDMIQNFSSMMQNNSNNKSAENHTSPSHSTNSVGSNESINSNSNSSSNNFDFSNIDMNTIMKIKSVMEQMNNTNDPRSNLLNSLKPYLRDSKKEKLDQYANLINIAKVAELFKNDNKETHNNG